MSVAKGRLTVTTEQLAIMLGLPQGVEVLALRPKVQDDSFEFLLVSADETVLTRKGISIGQLPTTKVELAIQEQPRPQEVHKGMAQISIDVNNNVVVENINNAMRQTEKDVKAIFDEIVKNVKVKGTK